MTPTDETRHFEAPASTGGPDWRSSGVLWGAATPVVAALVALIPLLFNARFYFYDDTQIGAYPIWFEIGSQVRDGVWPVFSAQGWQAGNYAAEGQWGIFSVLTIAIGVAASYATDAVLFSSAIKIVFLCTASIGIFLLARSYGVSAPLALAAGVTSVMAGFTVYLDSASWVTGLMVWAFLPLVWWALRRMVRDDRSPIPAILLGYLLISVGYVHGTIMLVLLFVAVIVEVAIARDWRQLRRVFFAGVILGLVALAVYLPGVLTLQSTSRKTIIDNTNFLTVDLSGFAGSTLATASPQVASWWWGPFAPVPLTYIAWFLPLLALVDFGRLRTLLAAGAAVPVYLLLSTALVLAPSDLGPLRTPVRLMPYVSLSVILLFFIAFSLARLARSGRVRWVAVGALFVGSAYVGWTGNPDTWKASALVSAVMALGFAAIAIVFRKRGSDATATVLAAGIVVLVSAAIAVPQHRFFPTPPVQDFLMSASVGDYTDQLAGAVGQTIVVGTPSALGDEGVDEALVGNSWYLNENPVHNLYSPTQNAAYATDLCMASRGETCDELASKLFEIDPTTSLPIADLLRVDSVQIVRTPEDAGVSRLLDEEVPEGWTLADIGEDSVLWTRDEPLGDVGAPVWESEGTSVELVSNENREVVFTVTAVPEDGGEVVLSRIDWPGYKVSGAELTDSLRDYLLTVSLDDASVGDTVTIRFDPPGWSLEIGSILLAALLTVTWGGLHWWRRRAPGDKRRLSVAAL